MENLIKSNNGKENISPENIGQPTTLITEIELRQQYGQ